MASGGVQKARNQITVPNDPYGDATDDCRVWLGNLDARLTEFSLLKVLQKYGPLKRFDFLLHRSGPDVGKPRGYCFVSYEHRQDAEKAVKGLNGKQALSKRMIVKWAHAEKPDLDPPTRLRVMSNPAPTTREDHQSPESTIKAIEAKLKSMEDTSRDFTMTTKPVATPGTSLLCAVHQQARQQNAQKSRPHHRPYSRRGHRR